MTAQPDGIPGRLWELHTGRVHVADDGTAEMTTTIRARDKRPGDGSRLIGWAAWLLAVLAAGVLAVSYNGQFLYIFGVRHQVIASNIEAGMFDVGMIIFAVLGLGLAFARKPSRIERACVMLCSLGSAGMNYAAADVTSPRSVAAYVAPPVFLAVVVDRVIAVVRRHRLGGGEGSPWTPLGAAALAAVRCAGLVLLYSLRLALDCRATARGLRRLVLNAAPLPAEPAAPAATPQGKTPAEGSKKMRLLTLYRAHPGYGDRSQASPVAKELAPAAQLQWATARTYIADELASLDGRR